MDIIKLMKIIERDVILVNKLCEVKLLKPKLRERKQKNKMKPCAEHEKVNTGEWQCDC